MKKLMYLFIGVLFVVACKTETNETQEVKIDMANLEKVELVVQGMTCSGCENTVEKSVAKLPGVASVKASHKAENAVIEFDKSQTNVGEIIKTITAKGYKASLPADVKEEAPKANEEKKSTL